MKTTSSRQEQLVPRVAGGDWFGQPRGLTILFLTDMWSQFSFYGMRALLVYYMTKQVHIPQQDASLIYGLYGAGVFLTPLLGGLVSDRWLGRTASVVLGGLIMATGHFMMVFAPLLYEALATIAIGSGLFMASLPGQIDGLYAADDPRRRSAYNIYYVGINLGAFLAPLVAGTIGEVYGWHWGFGVAGVGMVVGLLTYLAGTRWLPADPPRRSRIAKPGPASADKVWTRKAIRDRFGFLLCIAACVVVFRAGYEQIGNTVALWADVEIDRSVGAHWTIPLTWFQALNPLMVFSLTPVFVLRWTHQSRRGKQVSSVRRMAFGALVVAVSYLTIAAVSAWSAMHGGRASWAWMAGFVALLTAGELYILPVGLGLFGRLAPQGLSATTIATWYFAGFFGNLLAGWLGGAWSLIPHAAFLTVVAAVVLTSALLLRLIAPRADLVEQAA